MAQPKRYTVTSALPYANGPVHIGHLAGAYLPADIYVRYLRSKGEDVLFICGSDEHGVAITLRAKDEGTTPQAIVDKYHPMIRDSFAELGISFDIYSRTSSDLHKQTAQEFFLELYKKEVFEEKTTQQFYDVEHKQFLPDRYVKGICPHCHHHEAYGDQCEKCGSSLDPTDLKEPVSVLSGKTPEIRETTHWYLPLNKYEDWLGKWINEKSGEWKGNVMGQCRSWLTQGLKPRAITRDMKWGVPVPLPGAQGKALYVWFDAPIGYISATKDWSQKTGKDWEPWWKNENSRLVHFIGKDNIIFHCIIFPTMLQIHGDYVLPWNVPANEFLNLEGDKISTSRNHAVWLHEFLEDMPGKKDVLRYVLCSTMPEQRDNDFTWKEFQSRNNNELVAIFGNLVNRVTVLTHKYYNGEIPRAGKETDADKALAKSVKEFPGFIATSIENFRFREALNEFMNLARLGNKYLTDNEPWKIENSDPDRVKTIINNSFQVIANLCILGEPFLPFTTDDIRHMLNLEREPWKEAGSMHLVKAGTKINEARLLFSKIEDAEIDRQVQKLVKTQAESILASSAENEGVEAVKGEMIYEDFMKMDLRAGKIISAIKVPKADKLLELKVDLGFEVRTIVSGIAGYFSPDEIAGKQVCVVANLAPKKLRGILSHGMILMAEDKNGKLYFVSPEKGVPPGSVIR